MIGQIKTLLKKAFPHPLKDAYYIGFLTKDELSLPIVERYSKIKWIDVRDYEKEGWFADPFILSVNENIVELFAEEMVYSTGRGIIAYLKVDLNTCRILEKKTMLDLDSHLSFPIYIEEAGKLYVYPENYQSGSLKIYEYDSNCKKLLHPKTIINAPLLDTQIVKIDNVYYAFGVQFHGEGQNDTKRLYIYQSESLLGSYEQIQIIENPLCEERGAGVIYSEEGCLFRPAQCCEEGYGKAVIIYKLQKNGSVFEEKEATRIIPDRNARNGNVLHTYNCVDNVVVIDGWRYFYPRVAKIYAKVRGL